MPYLGELGGKGDPRADDVVLEDVTIADLFATELLVVAPAATVVATVVVVPVLPVTAVEQEEEDEIEEQVTGVPPAVEQGATAGFGF